MTWLAIKLFLGGALKRLTEALSALWGFALRHPREAAIVALLALSGWQTWRLSTVKQSLTTARAELVSQRYKFEQAIAANLAAQVAQKRELEAKLAAQAKENAYVEKALRAELGARAADYANRMRLDKVCRSAAPSPGKDSPAPVDNGPGSDAVVLERRDYDILIDNTVRLEAVHQWGKSLVKDGLAVEWPEPAF